MAKVAGASGVVEVARTITNTGITDVELEIVKGCLEFTRKDLTTPRSEVPAIINFEQDLRDRAVGPGGGTPTIRLSPSRGRATTPVAVGGDGWPPNEELEIRVLGNQSRVKTDAEGRFSATIRVPSHLGDKFFDGTNAEVAVEPVDQLLKMRSLLMRQTALYEITR